MLDQKLKFSPLCLNKIYRIFLNLKKKHYLLQKCNLYSELSFAPKNNYLVAQLILFQRRTFFNLRRETIKMRKIKL